MAGLEIGHGEKADHQSDDDTERDFHGCNFPDPAALPGCLILRSAHLARVSTDEGVFENASWFETALKKRLLTMRL
jgi:hypothetical protein